MGSSGIRYPGNKIGPRIISFCKQPSAFIPHLFHIDTLVGGSGITVIYPEKGTDLKLIPGRLKGLKEGSTTITAENNGFKASRIVHVGAAYGTVRENNNQDDSDNNDNPDSYQDQDQNQPYIYNNNRGGGGGCQMNNSGLYAVILILACALFMSKKIS